MNVANISSFKDDKLKLKAFCDKLERFLVVEREFVDGSLVISLNAAFGFGKTTFFRMWQADLKERAKSNSKEPQAIILNAWESDYCGDPLLPIISELIKTVETREAKPPEAGKLREAATDLAWFVTGLANSVVSGWAGIDPIAAGEFAESRKAKNEQKKPDFIALYEHRLAALQKLKKVLNEVFGKNGVQAFIFVDELDRCRPDYAISYLETIKHVFDIPGLTFVLAVDHEHLANSARALFGDKLKFDEYYRKFVHRNISLPPPDKSSVHSLAEFYIKTFISNENHRETLLSLDHTMVRSIVELIDAMHLSPRQMQEVFRIIGHATSDERKTRGVLSWSLAAEVIFLSTFKVGNSRIYHSIGHNTLTTLELGKLLISLLGHKKSRWWFYIYLTGLSIDQNGESLKKQDVETLLKNLGFIGNDSSLEQEEQLLNTHLTAWGDPMTNPIKMIYERIEAASTFSD